MINPGAYYTVQAWMVNDLGLRDKELLVYAIIHGFSQDGASVYSGSARYLAEWIGCSRPTVMKVLKSLTEKRLLIKRDGNQNGVVFCTYRTALGCKESLQGVKKFDTPCKESLSEGVKKFDTPCKESLHNNTRDNNILDNIDINTGNAGEPPAPPAGDPPGENGKKRTRKKSADIPKNEYGEYKHVKLTDEEHAKLVKKHGPEKTAALIQFLDEYMEDKPGYKSSSHYLAIGRWVVDAVNEKARRGQQAARPAPAGRGGYPGQTGPNGIAIDPAKNDRDAIF